MSKFCQECGKKLADNATNCPKCGYNFESTAPKLSIKSKKSKYTASLLAFFLGGLGIHWFYLNRPSKGVIYLLCGTVGWIFILPVLIIIIMCFVDSLLLWIKSDEKFDIEYN